MPTTGVHSTAAAAKLTTRSSATSANRYVATADHECVDAVPGCGARHRGHGRRRVREGMACGAQLLAGPAERGERNIVERGARDQELAQ